MMVIRGILVGALTVLSLAATCWADARLDQMSKQIAGATLSAENSSFIKENFAQEIVAKIYGADQSDDAEGVDFDIFTYSQDPDYEQVRKTLKSVVKKADDANAVIEVSFTQSDEKVVVDYLLKKSGERWVIDDVLYPADSYSLRSGLGLK